MTDKKTVALAPHVLEVPDGITRHVGTSPHDLSGADFQFAGFRRQMGFPPPRGGSNADVYLTGKQSRSFANSTGPEYRFLISDRV
jgi:hypothetical protein